MDMPCAAGIPAPEDRLEVDNAVTVGELNVTQISLVIAVSADSYMSGTRRAIIVVLPAERIKYTSFNISQTHRLILHKHASLFCPY